MLWLVCLWLIGCFLDLCFDCLYLLLRLSWFVVRWVVLVRVFGLLLGLVCSMLVFDCLVWLCWLVWFYGYFEVWFWIWFGGCFLLRCLGLMICLFWYFVCVCLGCLFVFGFGGFVLLNACACCCRLCINVIAGFNSVVVGSSYMVYVCSVIV